MSYDPRTATIAEAEAFEAGRQAGLEEAQREAMALGAVIGSALCVGVDFASDPDLTVTWRHSPPGEEPTGLEVRGG